MSLTSTTFSGQALAFKTGVPRAVNRTALAVQAKFSRIGKQLITVPSSVTVKLDGQAVHVKVGTAGGQAVASSVFRGAPAQQHELSHHFVVK